MPLMHELNEQAEADTPFRIDDVETAQFSLVEDSGRVKGDQQHDGQQPQSIQIMGTEPMGHGLLQPSLPRFFAVSSLPQRQLYG